MKTTPLIVAAAFVASAMALPVAADPPGNWSISFEFLTASYFDFKDGVGIANPSDQDNDCTALLLGLRGIQPIAETWEVDQNMGTNINGPAIGLNNLVGTLPGPMDPLPGWQAVGGWLPNSGGIDLGIECPIPGSSPGNIWLIWSGVNWRSIEADTATQLNLCTQKTFASSSPGCLAIPDGDMRLWASACDVRKVLFGGDYGDFKGKYITGIPFDTLRLKSDVIKCPGGWDRTIDYTDTIQDFTAGGASQTFDIIKNEAVVPGGGKDGTGFKTPGGNGKPKGDTHVNTSYMAICWQITYLNFSNPLLPTTHTAQTHDWKLIKDVQGFLNDLLNTAKLTTAPESYIDNLLQHILKWNFALQRHYGGARPGDNDVPLPSLGMRGFYSQDAGDPKDGGLPDGQNGFTCTGPAIPHSEKAKKPSPIL